MIAHAKSATVLVFGMAAFRPVDEAVDRSVRKLVGATLTLASAVAFTIMEHWNQEVAERAKVPLLEEGEQTEPPVLIHAQARLFADADDPGAE
jgi:hypothetical protein